jgi:hypothetical protein
MKKLFFLLLITILFSCANKEEVQKYASLRQENAIMITQCDYISKAQNHIYDSLGKIQEDFQPKNILLNTYRKSLFEK